MTQEEKLGALKAWLVENNIEHWVNVKVAKADNVVIPLYIRRYVIAVHVGDDQKWYLNVRRFAHPVFIREEDSIEFVIEKVQNVIITRMTAEQKASIRRAWLKDNKDKFLKNPVHKSPHPNPKRPIYRSMTCEEKVCVEPKVQKK